MSRTPKHRSNTSTRPSLGMVFAALVNPTTASSVGRRTAHLTTAGAR